MAKVLSRGKEQQSSPQPAPGLCLLGPHPRPGLSSDERPQVSQMLCPPPHQ